MATIPTPEQGKPILDFSAGTFDGSSYLFQSRNGATEHVSGDAVADYVNTSRIYNGLDTESKTPVGAINEVNRKIIDTNITSPSAGDVLAYDSTSSKWVNKDTEYYHVGDTINISALVLSCYANQSRLDIYVPLPKAIPSGATLTIAGDWRIILTNSNTLASSVVLNNAALSTIGTVSVVILEGGICIRVALNSGVIPSWSLGNAFAMGSNSITIS